MKIRSAFLSSILLSFVFAFSAVAQTNGVSRVTGDPARPAATAPATAIKLAEIQKDVAEALSVIERSHAVGSSIDYNQVIKSSIEGMLGALDPHSNYFDAKEFEAFRTSQSSRYFGIGATIGDLSDADGKVVATYIRATFDGAPAHRAGLRYGDRIVEVNGASVLGKSFPEVRDMLRGPRGTAAKLVVERHGTRERRNVEIVRDAVPQPSIQEAYMLRPGVGYIAMTGGFNQTTYAEFAEAMKNLKAKGMTQLVLDLKGNGGGLVSQAYRVANTFLQSGQNIFTQKGRIEGATQPFAAQNPNPETMPVVVLVNKQSASASEILAGALQDHDRALIAGETTFGKGLVQSPFPLEYGSMLLLTVAKYETPSGRLIQRDYSDGNLYNYYTGGGVGRDDEDEIEQPRGEEMRTDSGRPVYSGGGIDPDVEIKPDMIPIERARHQQRINNSVFAFAMDVAYGKVAGFEALKVDRPIRFNYDITAGDFTITNELYAAYKKYATKNFKYTNTQLDAEREFIERALRAELVTAAFGTTSSFQVFNESNTQLKKAIELLPQARQLAIEGARARANASTRNPAANR